MRSLSPAFCAGFFVRFIMSRGRKPIPAETREKMGNPGKRKINKVPDHVPVISEIAPELLKDDDALAVWNTLYPMLDNLTFIKETDKPLMGRYCAAFAEWVSVRRSLIGEGHTYETSSNHGDMKRKNPLHDIRMDLEKLIIKYEEKLGLTPIDRQTLLNRIVANGGNLEELRKNDMGTTPDYSDDSPLGFALRAKMH